MEAKKSSKKSIKSKTAKSGTKKTAVKKKRKKKKNAVYYVEPKEFFDLIKSYYETDVLYFLTFFDR